MKETIQHTLMAALTAAVLAGGASVYADEPAETADPVLPKVPVRVLRPHAGEAPRPMDAFSTGVPVAVGSTDTTGYQLNAASQIAMHPGQNVFVPIAVNHPNRFLTPFKNPQVVSTTLSGGSKKGDCGEIGRAHV